MRNIVFTALISVSFAANAFAQSTLRLRVDDAVKMALDHNSDLRADRIDPQISDTRVAAAAAAFRPTFNTRLRESLVHTTANVKSAYWNLVSARAAVETRQSALALARELARVNKAKVDVGQSPPLDLVSAQAEVAADQEQLIIAQTTVKEAEDRLRILIFDTSDRSVWNVTLDLVDSPPVGMVPLDVDAAISNTLRDRAD